MARGRRPRERDSGTRLANVRRAGVKAKAAELGVDQLPLGADSGQGRDLPPQPPRLTRKQVSAERRAMRMIRDGAIDVTPPELDYDFTHFCPDAHR